MNWTLFSIGANGWGDELLWGFALTMTLAIAAYVIGTVIGLFAALALLSKSRILRPVSAAYGTIFRSVPELLILFLTYYGAALMIRSTFALIGIDLRVSLDAFTAGVVALALVHGAYTAEVFRGAIISVPTGLREAARSLGMTPFVTFHRIVFPVALRYAFPGLSNLWMVMIKNTPLVSAIGLADLIGQANTAGQNTKHYFAFFTAALIAYLFVSAVSLWGQIRLERNLTRHLPKQGSWSP
ncbi:ABC transporter permease [Oceaniradius stylonematis]|uniref:ABC transporter permease n=1 Tax=Oceaniradius stylonematis TaxID=2184161 RepID=UPI003C797ACC